MSTAPKLTGEQRYANLTANLHEQTIDTLKNTVVALELQLEAAQEKIAELTPKVTPPFTDDFHLPA